MFRLMIKAGLMLCLLVLVGGVEGRAQDTIPPAKRELIKELLVLTGGQKTTDAILNSVLDQTERDLSTLLPRMLDKQLSLSPGEREEFNLKMRESMARANKRFRQLFSEKVNFAQLVDNISYSIYDKYFTEDELRDLVTFYQTPTGRKTIEVLPQLFTDSMTKTSEVLIPKMQQIVDEVLAEEKARLDKEVPPANPAPARTKKRGSRS
jgi:hypothetical protein